MSLPLKAWKMNKIRDCLIISLLLGNAPTCAFFIWQGDSLHFHKVREAVGVVKPLKHPPVNQFSFSFPFKMESHVVEAILELAL